jgi:replicative DNA helicase
MTEFNDDYVYSLLKLAINDQVYTDVLTQHLKYQYIPNEQLKEVWKAIQTEYSLSEVKKPPSIGVLKMQFRKNIKVLNEIDNIKKADIDDKQAIIVPLEDFLKRNMFIEGQSEVVELFNKGKDKEAYKKFIEHGELLAKFSLQAKAFEGIFKDFDRRVFERELDKLDSYKNVRIPTGIDELDHYIRGFELGEFILFLGDSGSGKSFLLNHLGVNAARRGYKVLHFQAEGTRRQCTNRYDSAWTGTIYHDLKDNNISEATMNKCRKIIRSIGGEIFVDCFEKFESKTMLDIRNSIIEVKKEHPDLMYVILDYMDLVNPGDERYKHGEERFRQAKIARMCKDIAVEQKVIFISATQASSVNPELLNDPTKVITRYNLAEDKGKLRPTDALITLNSTLEERKQNIMRLFIDKYREQKAGQVIHIYQNLKRSRFYDRKLTLEHFFNNDKSEDYIGAA